MDYEKKYKEALERARCLYSQHSIEWCDKDIVTIFPELKESEDERIRKEIIDYIERLTAAPDYVEKYNSWLVWLEKQGEPTDINPSEFDLRLNKLLKQFETLPKEELASSLGFYLNVVQNDGTYKIDEKPTDKVEPKFKIGDWIIWYNCIYQVLDNNLTYIVIDTKGLESRYEHSTIDKVARYWTIDDAKDGDIICVKNAPFIYWHHDSRYIYTYCTLNFEGEFLSLTPLCWDIVTYYGEIFPATKEQRETLFAKMKEAGYEWNAEKKELKLLITNGGDFDSKNCELNPAWSKDDNHEHFSELLENDNSDNIDDYAYQCTYCMSHDWMKDTATWDDVERACKLGAEWNERHHKSAWSEEDEHRLKDTIYFLETAKKHYASTVELDACIDWLKNIKDRVQPQPKQEWSEEDEKKRKRIMHRLSIDGTINNEDLADINEWLKSLKQRIVWKPSDEQITVLELASKYERVFTPKQIDILIGLKEQLKELKGE